MFRTQTSPFDIRNPDFTIFSTRLHDFALRVGSREFLLTSFYTRSQSQGGCRDFVLRVVSTYEFLHTKPQRRRNRHLYG